MKRNAARNDAIIAALKESEPGEPLISASTVARMLGNLEEF